MPPSQCYSHFKPDDVKRCIKGMPYYSLCKTSFFVGDWTVGAMKVLFIPAKKIKMVLQSITIHQVESDGFQICTSSLLKNVPCSSFLARVKFHHKFSITFLYCSLIPKNSKGFIHQIFVLIQNNIIIIAAFIKIAAWFKESNCENIYWKIALSGKDLIIQKYPYVKQNRTKQNNQQQQKPP